MLRSIALILGFLFFAGVATAQEKLPVPADSKERLFYLQRDPNSNTIIYDINYLPDGSIDEEKPVRIYWIKYARGGAVEELLPIEEKLAYGAAITLTDKQAGLYKMNMVAYKKLDILLKPAKTGPKKYHAEVTANGKTLQLHKVFLRLENPNSFKPKLIYIELTGKDVKTGKTVTEKVVPENA